MKCLLISSDHALNRGNMSVNWHRMESTELPLGETMAVSMKLSLEFPASEQDRSNICSI